MGLALIIMFVAMAFIPAGDAAGKLLTAEFGVAPVFVAWARFAVGAAVTVPIAPRETWRLLRDWRVWGRGLALAGGILSILTALSTAPLANVFAALFIGPIISFVLSAILLKEPVTVLRSILVALGFAGVLLVVRPGLNMAPGMGFAVLAGFFYGIYLTASRALSGLGRPRSLLTTQLIAGTVALAPLALGYAPPALTWGMALAFVASGLASMLGNLLLVVAYSRASATVLAPMVYFQLLAATGLGWLVFGDLPDALTWAGLALIVVAGVASARLAQPRTDRG
ncbi:DMT family transporter [Mesobacterium sp. TK19101]|uniref:DMT family transporter n=1 Tax=Mesobacterium hydrothermale TaxID=3111907 RepID=A0ABU6HIX6_9RHOB|nr:DMT family transporter [Mesobacterium sp. TK19101]MEC3862062.1 DMT family transporter [Mesobacterium sp. TK19101]